MTLSPLIIGLISFAVLAGGAFVGWETRQRLPAHHLNEETKSLVSVSMAVVGTISALVLGLLISNANTSFSELHPVATGHRPYPEGLGIDLGIRRCPTRSRRSNSLPELLVAGASPP